MTLRGRASAPDGMVLGLEYLTVIVSAMKSSAVSQKKITKMWQIDVLLSIKAARRDAIANLKCF